MMLMMSSAVSQPEEWHCSVVWWYGNRYCCVFCQMAAGWTDWLGGCCLLVSFGVCADISLHWFSGDSTCDVLGSFNHPLSNLPVLGRFLLLFFKSWTCHRNLAFRSFLKEQRLNQDVDVWWPRMFRVIIMLIPRNLILLTCSTAALLM